MILLFFSNIFFISSFEFVPADVGVVIAEPLAFVVSFFTMIAGAWLTSSAGEPEATRGEQKKGSVGESLSSASAALVAFFPLLPP